MRHLLARLYLTRVGEAADAIRGRVEGMTSDGRDLVEAELGHSAHLAGAAFSAADVQMMFPREFSAYGGLLSERHSKLRDYLERMQARPAYRRAVDKGGSYALDATSIADTAPFPTPSR